MNLSFDAFMQMPCHGTHGVMSPVGVSSVPSTQTTAAETNQTPSPATSAGGSRRPPGTIKTTSDLGNSYHSDSLSSDDFTPASAIIAKKQVCFIPISSCVQELSSRYADLLSCLQQSQESSPHVRRGRRDSGCYLSNENLNNNSSNSSTSEKSRADSSRVKPAATAATGDAAPLHKEIESLMREEGIQISASPYTDEVRVLTD